MLLMLAPLILALWLLIGSIALTVPEVDHERWLSIDDDSFWLLMAWPWTLYLLLKSD